MQYRFIIANSKYLLKRSEAYIKCKMARSRTIITTSVKTIELEGVLRLTFLHISEKQTVHIYLLRYFNFSLTL